MKHAIACVVLTTLSPILLIGETAAEELPDTRPLTTQGDIAAEMVAGVDRFLLREIENSVSNRSQFWDRDFSSAAAYENSIAPNRTRLAYILGVRDKRLPFDGLELVATTAQSHVVGRGDTYQILAVRWPVIHNMHGEGLLLVPDRTPIANVIAIPDATQTPETICGLVDGVEPNQQFARRLAENGCRVLVPTVIDRQLEKRGGRAEVTNREYLYRSAFELGRHLIGYEIQKVLAGLDWFERDNLHADVSVGVIGYGDGGMIALYAAALDRRIDVACVNGYFGSRQRIWEQPLDRNVFGLLEQFGDAELASMVLPRRLIIDSSRAPQIEFPSSGGAPAILRQPTTTEVQQEIQRLQQLAVPWKESIHWIAASSEADLTSESATEVFLMQLTDQPLSNFTSSQSSAPERLADLSAGRHRRQFLEMEEINQWFLQESLAARRKFMNIGLSTYDNPDGSNRLDTASPAAYEKSIAPFREYFRREVVGHFDYPLMAANPRSRQIYDEEKWSGYELMLDVFPDVFAYGILCLPKDLKPGEKRPVVVCQHGLEGRPQDVIAGDHRAYHDFAAKLTEQGFITFAPQNLYIGQDRFRTLQRKANPLKKTLFSVIVPQHQQIVNWLKTLPYVDSQRIAFYGLSYGGKSAMRIPPLVTDYCLSICSADFNEWVDKNATTRGDYSYVWTGEYEIFEFDLGSTFNYAEMAALIAPRPFMVERGHFDGVGTDENVAFEFARVRHLYAARLGLADRCDIEWFVGPHTIHGVGTFAFLRKHLNHPPSQP